MADKREPESADLGCQPDYIWNQQKSKLLGMIVKDFLPTSNPLRLCFETALAVLKSIDWADLNSEIHLPLPPKCWD